LPRTRTRSTPRSRAAGEGRDGRVDRLRSDQDLRVSLVQGDTGWHDPSANRAKYDALLAPLAGATDLVVLPETFTSGFSNEAIHRAETMDGPTVAWIREKAAALGAVVTGSVQIRDDAAASDTIARAADADGPAPGVFNRLLWATPGGDLRYYDKRHLFRMAREHERYASGRNRITVDLLGWRVCPLVCYDLRFPRVHPQPLRNEAADRFDYDLLVFVANWPRRAATRGARCCAPARSRTWPAWRR
jgi:predicted amidohydrolase